MKPLYNRIAIVGAGSSFWLVVALCRILEDKGVTIEVWDDDTFVGGNGSSRLPKPLDPNQFKVAYLETFVRHVMRDTTFLTVHPEKLLPSHFAEGDWSKTIVVDGTDMGRKQRELFWEALEQAGARGIRLALDVIDGQCVNTVSPGPPIYMGDEEEQHTEYTQPPHLGQVFRSVGYGTEAVLYLLYTGKVTERDAYMPTPEGFLAKTGGEND